MSVKSVLSSLLLLGAWGFGQSTPTVPPANPTEATAPVSQSGTASETNGPAGLSNSELLARAKKIFVVSETFYVKKEQLESGLINRKELAAWGIQVVDSERAADLILKVKRAPFQSNFPFTFTDRESKIVVLGGTVSSHFGTVPSRIADRLVDKLKEIHKPKQP
jgi:hypothetical protein